eukprot:1225889-Pyramimonas_sp.AAC.1
MSISCILLSWRRRRAAGGGARRPREPLDDVMRLIEWRCAAGGGARRPREPAGAGVFAARAGGGAAPDEELHL